MTPNKFSEKLLFFIFFIFFPFTLKAQYYSIGQDPASIKWKQIKTDNFKIIYPENFEKNVQYLANTLQYTREYGTKSLGYQPKQLKVILHNRTVVSNAFSIWAPKRCEFYTCPPQDTYPQDWLEQLSLHEYRHIAQIGMLNKGFTKFLSLTFGEQGTAAVLGLFVPLWFVEGDAVCTETALSRSGRGRIPSFEMSVRTQVLSDKIFSYDKAVLGSYKDYVPDHYVFGYQMVAGARKKYGAEIWKSAMNNTAKYPFLITPFNKGIKEVSGLSKTKLYKSIYFDLDSLWKIQREQLAYTKFKSLTPDKKKIYTNYKLPHYLNDSVIITEKSGMDDITRFIVINKKNENEKIEHTPGFISYESLSTAKIHENSSDSYLQKDSILSDDIIVWAERKFDKRWGLRNYSVINTHNLKTSKTKQLSKKTRYFTPSFFSDAKRLVTVEVAEDNTCSIIILNSINGEIIKKIPAGDNSQFLTPSVSDNGKYIVVVLLNKKGKSIVFINSETGQLRTILKPSFDDVDSPKLFKNYVFFNASYSGIENIYALDTLSGNLWQVTSALYGSKDIDVSPNGKNIIYSNYTYSGYQIAETIFNPSQWKPITQIIDNSVQLFKGLISEETGLVDSVNIPNKYYEPKKYNKWQHLFNPHSWAPAFVDVGNYKITPGFSLMSQNMLSTTFATLGYDYNLNDAVGKYYANISYRGWYPVLDFTYSRGKEAFYLLNNKSEKQKYVWNLSDINFGISIPLTFTYKKYIQNIIPRINIRTVVASDIPAISGYKVLDKIQVVDYSVIAYNRIISVERDMLPCRGQQITLEYKHTPFGGNDIGAVINAELLLMFPGIMKHHSFMLIGGMQKKYYKKSSFSDLLFYPRGYKNESNDELKSISLNYKLPLFYPDFKIGSLLYFKRFKANLFYDYSIGQTLNVTKKYCSTGIELTSDFNLLRFVFPIDAGIRAVYIPETKNSIFEMLINISFN